MIVTTETQKLFLTASKLKNGMRILSTKGTSPLIETYRVEYIVTKEDGKIVVGLIGGLNNETFTVRVNSNKAPLIQGQQAFFKDEELLNKYHKVQDIETQEFRIQSVKKYIAKMSSEAANIISKIDAAKKDLAEKELELEDFKKE